MEVFPSLRKIQKGVSSSFKKVAREFERKTVRNLLEYELAGKFTEETWLLFAYPTILVLKFSWRAYLFAAVNCCNDRECDAWKTTVKFPKFWEFLNIVKHSWEKWLAKHLCSCIVRQNFILAVFHEQTRGKFLESTVRAG